METTRISTEAKIKQIKSLHDSMEEFTVYVNTVSLRIYFCEGAKEALDNEIKDLEDFKEEWANDNCGRFVSEPSFVSLSDALGQRNRYLHELILEHINDSVLYNMDSFEVLSDVENRFFC